MRHLILIAVALALAGCGNGAPVSIGQEAAKYEAQKLLAALKGQAGSAAFMDVVLRDEAAYRRLFMDGLKRVIDAAPIHDPAFTPYQSCVESGRALLKFAELRKLAGRQNDESDQYRRPYWDDLATCEKAVKR